MNYDLTVCNERAPLKARELEGEARKALAYSRFSQRGISACGRDAEVRYTPSGTAICNFSVATSSRRKDKASGESIEDIQWHCVTFYECLAKVAGEYLKKGKRCFPDKRTRTDFDGIERNTVDIVAEQMLTDQVPFFKVDRRASDQGTCAGISPRSARG